MLSVSFDSYDSTFCMVIVPFYKPFLSCAFSIHFSISYIVFIIRFQKVLYCLFFSQCRFRFSMITFLILYGKLCNYFIWHDALRAIVVGGKFESGIRVMQKF